jgi:uncharacterized protein (TIGR02268 family)
LSVPATLALVLLLLGGTQAQAQPAPTRERRERSVILTGHPQEVRVGQGIRTVLLFGVPVQGRAVEVDRTRIKVVDTGERSIIIEALSEPRAGERWPMRVPLAEGKSLQVAEFELVSSPSEVDTEIDVAPGERLDTACHADCAPCTAMSLADAIAAGLIDKSGVQTGEVKLTVDTASGLESRPGVSYRGKGWVLVDVRIIPPSGHPSWRPAGATLKSKTGEARVRAVKVEPSNSSARGVRVLVETDAPPPSAGLEFVLHLTGADGAPSLSIPAVNLPPAQERTP